MGCRPAWAPRFEGMRETSISGGCVTILNPASEDFGYNPCPPEVLRRATEVKLRALGLWGAEALPLDVYSLARNIATEIGSGTPEMKVALALSTMGQARLRGQSVSQLILRNDRCPSGGPSGSGCLYGRIHGATTSTAPFARFTASSLDPSPQDIAIAMFALSGGAGTPGDLGNFAHGADDQWGPNGAADCGTALNCAKTKMRSLARKGIFWVGPIPSVDPLALHLFATRPDIPKEQWTAFEAAQEPVLDADVAHPTAVRQGGQYVSTLDCVDPSSFFGVRVAGIPIWAGLLAVGGYYGYKAWKNKQKTGRWFPKRLDKRRS